MHSHNQHLTIAYERQRLRHLAWILRLLGPSTGQTNPRQRHVHKRTNLFTYQRANLPDRNTSCTANAVPQGIRPISIIFRRQSFPDLSTPSSNTAVGGGGGGRDRTDDPLLAKQVLSQLSYAPISAQPQRGCTAEDWWAREDLNLRPHAYQACALTN